MKLVFVSNFFNHHQKGISDYFYKNTDRYRFVSTTSIPDERKKLGYEDYQEPYLIFSDIQSHMPDDIDDADVYICACSNGFGKDILMSKKCVFYYSERINKKAVTPLHILSRYIKLRFLAKNKNLCLLSASAYAAADYNRINLFKTTAFKWGYFPATKRYQPEELLIQKNKKQILWCGRFLAWKHPDDAIIVASMLKKAGADFKMTVIGAGEMGDKLKQMVFALELSDRVEILGSMPPDRVRLNMEQAGIFLFTSDRQEGWGAVLNEAMNSGCAVVASHAIGSVPYLIKNNENGLIYRSGDMDSLYKKVKYLLDNPIEQDRLGDAAYQTIVSEWNAETAGERFIALSQKILDGQNVEGLYKSGPCSKAEHIKDDWYHE